MTKSAVTHRGCRCGRRACAAIENATGVGPLLVIVFICLFVANCRLERDTRISIDAQNPLTFRLEGSGHQDFFLVRKLTPREMVPSSKRPILNGGILWQIWPPDGAKGIADNWPPIAYGKVPPEFKQSIPEGAQPQSLEEGEFYEAGGSASDANGGSIWFTIRAGQAVKIIKPAS